jgi:hypothetical protein
VADDSTSASADRATMNVFMGLLSTDHSLVILP